MSSTALNGLRDYLFGTLSADDMMWLAEELKRHLHKGTASKPYSMEEIDGWIDESERQMAANLCEDEEDVYRELKEELANGDNKDLGQAV